MVSFSITSFKLGFEWRNLWCCGFPLACVFIPEHSSDTMLANNGFINGWDSGLALNLTIEAVIRVTSNFAGSFINLDINGFVVEAKTCEREILTTCCVTCGLADTEDHWHCFCFVTCLVVIIACFDSHSLLDCISSFPKHRDIMGRRNWLVTNSSSKEILCPVTNAYLIINILREINEGAADLGVNER